MKIKIILPVLFFFYSFFCNAQLKFIIEDFEGFADGTSDLQKNGMFAFGNITSNIHDHESVQRSTPDYLGEKYISVTKKTNEEYGGWGKGIGLNVELDPKLDHINFYVSLPSENNTLSCKIQLQEDDNDNNVYEKDKDDEWIYVHELKPFSSKENWQLISIPLNKFRDSLPGGDGIFNCNYKQGRLLCFIVSFLDPQNMPVNQTVSFDFICFSQGALPENFLPEKGNEEFCSLGLWSKEGNMANFTEIGTHFEELFKKDPKKLGVIHFFQPFAVDGGNSQNLYPSVERINKVILEGYIPMITLENHFVNLSKANSAADSKMKQPNLYSIVEGHLDEFFIKWAKQIKQVKGTVLLRILHEFNGNWYPWCVANNDKDPALLIKAFRHIHDIFKSQQVQNVKFIWCPNSMSVPQEKWNYIMDAYPGDEYVDLVGMDIYNGAGQKFPIWASFKKVGIENYFILTQKLPGKPLIICETASREREKYESNSGQTKAGWIKQQSEALRTDMHLVKLLTWFNEKGTFKINSSPESKEAFFNYIIKDDRYKSGTTYLKTLIR